jgi:glycine cleavage system H protein
VFPDDLSYSSQHEWVRVGSGATVRIGITSFAADALGDIVFVSLPQVGEEVARDDACAEVESTKSVSDVYSPASGVVTSVNELLATNPESVNTDPYGDGWLFELELSDSTELDDLLDSEEYAATIDE